MSTSNSGASLAAKSQKTKSQPVAETPPTPQSSRVSRMLGSIWRPMPLLVMSLSLTGVMFWPQLVHLLPDLTAEPEYQLAWTQVAVPSAGRWVPQNFKTQVQQQSELSPTLSLLDDGLVSSLAEAFAHHPWVQSVESVKKRSDSIDVELTYREPVLMVQTQRGLYPVDAEAVLLPPTDFTAADAELFPLVEQVRSTPQGPAGTGWGDLAVEGAAELAARLTRGNDHETPWDRYGLAAITVLSQQGPVANVEDVIFGLTTKTGSRIVWGHAPGADGLEPTVAQKLERLDKFLADNGSFEYLNQRVLIDIRGWEMIRWDVLSQASNDGVSR